MNSKPWDLFQKATAPDSPLARATGAASDICYTNSRYQVNIRECGEIPPFGCTYQLSIKRRDREPILDWRDMQRIKTELIGPEAEMVQLFPAESRHVDTANQFYFFAFPGYRFPFGFQDRFLSESANSVSTTLIPGAVQRPFGEHAEQHPDIGQRDEEYRRLIESITDKAQKGMQKISRSLKGVK